MRSPEVISYSIEAQTPEELLRRLALGDALVEGRDSFVPALGLILSPCLLIDTRPPDADRLLGELASFLSLERRDEELFSNSGFWKIMGRYDRWKRGLIAHNKEGKNVEERARIASAALAIHPFPEGKIHKLGLIICNYNVSLGGAGVKIRFFILNGGQAKGLGLDPGELGIESFTDGSFYCFPPFQFYSRDSSGRGDWTKFLEERRVVGIPALLICQY